MTTFLIIDDDKIDRMIVERAFTENYPQVKCLQASSIMTALDVADKTKIDMFVIDITLSDGTGFDCVGALRDKLQYSTFPVVLMSGDIRSADREAAISARIEKVLLKPMRRAENAEFTRQVYSVYESFISTNRLRSVN